MESSSPQVQTGTRLTPYSAMQAAVDIVGQSEHPDNKIAATLFGTDWAVSRYNYWPDPIAERIGRRVDIGNSSGTVHAETASIFSAPQATEGASICITDPPCPNCAKNIAETGIKTVYIDHKGFDKDFFKRRAGEFENMSLRIFEHAGISVYRIHRKEQKIEPIFECLENYIPADDSPILSQPIETVSEAVFHSVIEEATRFNSRRKFAIALTDNGQGQRQAFTARAHAVTGFTMEKDIEDALDMLTPIGKYSFIQEPVNRMLMYLARHGLKPVDGYLYCSQVPTSREQVNVVGAGISQLAVGNTQKCRDPSGIKAMKQLKEAGILNYS